MGELEPEGLSQLGASTPVALQASQQKSFLIGTISWFRDLMLSVLIAVLVILFLYRPVKVEGTSMMPSLFDQERLSSISSPINLSWATSSAAIRSCSGIRKTPRSHTSSG